MYFQEVEIILLLTLYTSHGKELVVPYKFLTLGLVQSFQIRPKLKFDSSTKETWGSKLLQDCQSRIFFIAILS